MYVLRIEVLKLLLEISNFLWANIKQVLQKGSIGSLIISVITNPE
jgi:hypothetical protein